MTRSAVEEFRSVRWTDYVQDEDGWVYPTGDRRPDYVVDGSFDLPAFFARVPGSRRIEAHVEALLDFYAHFGLLGQTRLEGPHPEGKPRVIRRDGDRMVAHGDQLAWALAHAENVRWILALLGARGQTRQRWLRAAQEQEARLHTVEVPTVTPSRWGTPLGLRVATLVRESTEVVAANHLVAARLNPNLVDVTRYFDPTHGDQFRFRALIQVIYWQVADRAGTRPGRCRCGNYFFPRDARQRFCPAPPGATESRCAVRRRVQRFRRRHRIV